MLTGMEAFSGTCACVGVFFPFPWKQVPPEVFLIFTMPVQNPYQHQEMLRGATINRQGIILGCNKRNTGTQVQVHHYDLYK